MVALRHALAVRGLGRACPAPAPLLDAAFKVARAVAMERVGPAALCARRGMGVSACGWAHRTGRGEQGVGVGWPGQRTALGNASLLDAPLTPQPARNARAARGQVTLKSARALQALRQRDGFSRGKGPVAREGEEAFGLVRGKQSCLFLLEAPVVLRVVGLLVAAIDETRGLLESRHATHLAVEPVGHRSGQPLQ